MEVSSLDDKTKDLHRELVEELYAVLVFGPQNFPRPSFFCSPWDRKRPFF